MRDANDPQPLMPRRGCYVTCITGSCYLQIWLIVEYYIYIHLSTRFETRVFLLTTFRTYKISCQHSILIYSVRLYQLRREDTQARESDITLRHKINVVGLWVYGRERTQFEMASRSLARWRRLQTRENVPSLFALLPLSTFH